jgi:hypothetical protein
MGAIWVGVDVGKTHHHVAAVDDAGRLVLSQQVANDQLEIAAIVAQFGRRRGQVRWGVDLRTGPAALFLAVLLGRGVDVRYVSGSVASRMAEAFHGEHKTDRPQDPRRAAAAHHHRPRRHRQRQPRRTGRTPTPRRRCRTCSRGVDGHRGGHTRSETDPARVAVPVGATVTDPPAVVEASPAGALLLDRRPPGSSPTEIVAAVAYWRAKDPTTSVRDICAKVRRSERTVRRILANLSDPTSPAIDQLITASVPTGPPSDR